MKYEVLRSLKKNNLSKFLRLSVISGEIILDMKNYYLIKEIKTMYMKKFMMLRVT